MKTHNLLLTALLSGSLLAGCLDLSSEDKDELKAFLDGYAEEDNQAVGLADARDKDYLGSTDVDASNTTGNARVGGEVAVSSLESTSQANSFGSNTNSSRASRAADTLTEDNFTVSFINGSGVKTTITGTYTVLIHYPSDGGDPQFIIEGLGDGVNYIVEVAVTVDGESVKLKSVAHIPKGATKSEKAVIDPVSTVVAEAVQEKIVSGYFETGGDKFSQDYISDLKETMTAIIEEVIASNPEISVTNFKTALSSQTGVDNLVSKLLADESVNEGLKTLEDVAIEEKFEAPSADEITSAEVARKYMGNLFNELFNDNGDDGAPKEGGGAPQAFIDFFGDKFFAQETQTIEDLFGALEKGLVPRDDPDTVADESALPSPFNSTEQTAALTKFKAIFAFIYSAVTQVENKVASVQTSNPFEGGTFTRTLEEARNFLDKDIPPTLLAVFPPKDKTTLANYSMTSTVNVPQAITMVFFVLDVFKEENCDSSTQNCENGGGGDDFNPMTLLTLYGFDPSTDAATYGGVEIQWLGVHPGSMWISDTNGGTQVDVLNAFTCVDNFFAGNNFDVTGVSLSYPTSTGTASVNLVDESTYPNRGGDGDSSCWAFDIGGEQELLIETGGYGSYDAGDIDWSGLSIALASSIISDFTSGDYTVTVNYTDNGTAGTESRTFKKKIITGLQGLNPRLTTPASEPRRPEGNVSEAEWQDFNVEQEAFVMTTFPVGAIGTISWNAPANLANAIPEGVIAAYSLKIGKQTNCDSSGGNCEWQHIYSTWDDNTRITKTQFELPKYVKELLVENTDANAPYEMNLNINFLDAQTGEYLGQGGHSNGRFLVGAAILGSDTFTIRGSTSNIPNSDFTDSTGTTYPASAYKVAMVKGSCDEISGCTQTTILSSDIAEDGSYSLTPTFDQVKGSSGSWINIVMYIDSSGDDEFNAGTDTNNFNGEPHIWSDDNVNFNTWGGILRINFHSCDETSCDSREEAAVPDGVYDGPTFDAAPSEDKSAAGTVQ